MFKSLKGVIFRPLFGYYSAAYDKSIITQVLHGRYQTNELAMLPGTSMAVYTQHYKKEEADMDKQLQSNCRDEGRVQTKRGLTGGELE